MDPDGLPFQISFEREIPCGTPGRPPSDGIAISRSSIEILGRYRMGAGIHRDEGGIVGRTRRPRTMDALLQEEGLPRRDRRGKKRSSAALSDLERAGGDGEGKEDAQPERDASNEGTPSRRYVDQTAGNEETEEGTDGRNYEYRDHTADIQLHAWGKNMAEAFENVGLAMFNYMTPLSGVSVDPSKEKTYKMQAHDMQSLLFAFLDELLFIFNTEFFVCKEIRIVKFNRETWEIEAQGLGETFSPETHVMGTEIKAITYSAMQANESEERAEVYVIVDI
eukprot:scaffold2858_cov659-Pavlova_lutheri.AAC.217